MNKILLAVDGSENAKRAVDYVLKMTRKQEDLMITVIHIINSQKEITKLRNISSEIQDIKERVVKNGMEIIERHVSIFENNHIKVATKLLDGDPATKIVEYAKLGEYDHIVLGTRGLTDLQSIVLGSVSHKVLALSECPVTFIK
ncbi:universal stress protein [Desulforamulus aeronauticus]|uniref:Nucleotide-binding universal stress protein, UspA family n=1 Tax=Desulforamulus aeronauticus DSM 10349 TaxID=1121421 RepID=A0A1M6QB34_9FIRM|nr:universal stress protein [Desulforamulus aeronauticus]SHK17303.1 Nucleotide-binding universal stress protein, UspA family [Desulforamulus aeronauticus DSM 10349]